MPSSLQKSIGFTSINFLITPFSIQPLLPVILAMKTLPRWKHLAANPYTLECSDIQLVGLDSEGALISGPGRIEIDSTSGIRFSMYGSMSDTDKAFRRIVSASKNPYDALEQFRLFATDYEGNEWNGGYTAVNFFTDHKHGWPLAGELQGLSTKVIDDWVAPTSSVELLFAPAFSLPLSELMKTKTTIDEEELNNSSRRGRHVFSALSTEIKFAIDPSGNELWLTAKTSKQLKHPFAELLLLEPLRILLGAPVCPRLIARNMGDGSAHVILRPPAQRQIKPSLIGLMPLMVYERTHGEQFWQLYTEILSMIAAEDKTSMQSHAVTQHYEELSQALLGSRWVIILTLASTVEALAKSLMSEEDKRSTFCDATLDSMKEHLKSWKGDCALRGRMLSELGKAKKRGVQAFLKKMGKDGKVEEAHVAIWRKLRNSVMHGELTEPWPTEEGDKHMRELITLVHGLTRTLIAKR